MSLRGRLTLMSALIVGAILAAGAVLCYVVMSHELRGQVDQQLEGQSRLIAEVAGRAPALPRRLPKLPAAVSQGSAPYSQFVLPDGRVRRVDPGQGRLPVTPDDLAVAQGNRALVLQDRTIDAKHVRVITQPVAGRGAIQLGRPMSSTDNVLDSLRLVLLLLVAGGLGLAALASRLSSRPVLAPIEELTAATEHIQLTGDLGRRVDARRADEVGRLAASFNAMLGQMQRAQDALADSMAAQRQLVADASHELRTPVTSLRTNIEVLLADEAMASEDRKALMRDVVDQTEELSAVVSDLIELARGDRPDEDREDLDLADIARDAVARARRHAHGVEYAADLEPWPMSGGRERLGRAVNNLLDNAAKFSPPGSTVSVSLRGGELIVRDHGPGVPAADLPHIFDRFFRGDDASRVPGSGLGLAIVKQVTESHRAALHAGPADGGGLEIRLRFAPSGPGSEAWPPATMP